MVGHSLGVAFSLFVKIRFPQSIICVVLICPAWIALDAKPKVFRSLEIKTPERKLFFPMSGKGLSF